MVTDLAWFWLTLAVVALMVELLHHTYYLLAVAAALFCGAAVALWPQSGLAAQLWVIAGTGLVGLDLARIARRRWLRAAPNYAAAQPGAEVRVLRAEAGRLRVAYRGSEWDAVYDGPPPAPGDRLKIAAMEGSLLKLVH
jgi:membrane protein implicated in regulation of membrane protease activity